MCEENVLLNKCPAWLIGLCVRTVFVVKNEVNEIIKIKYSDRIYGRRR